MAIGTGNIDTSDGVAVGAGSQANSQSVNIHLEAPPESASVKEQIRFQTLAMMQLQSNFVSDRNEREARQRDADAWRRTINYWLIGLTLLTMINTALIALRW